MSKKLSAALNRGEHIEDMLRDGKALLSSPTIQPTTDFTARSLSDADYTPIVVGAATDDGSRRTGALNTTWPDMHRRERQPR